MKKHKTNGAFGKQITPSNLNIKKDIKPPIYAFATTAKHKSGDMSRGICDISENVCRIYTEDDENYIGEWITGIGAFNVKFPKETTRALTKEEIDELEELKFQISNQPSFSLGEIKTLKK